MTTRSFASLAFKLLGTYALVMSVAGLRQFATALYSFPRSQPGLTVGTYKVMLLLPLLPALVFGIILIAKSSVFARWSVSTEGEVEAVVPAVRTMQSLAFSVLGVFFFIFGVVRLVGVIAILMTTSPVKPSVFGSVMGFPSHWPQLAEGLVQLAMGAFLFFGAGSLSKSWQRYQAPQQ